MALSSGRLDGVLNQKVCGASGDSGEAKESDPAGTSSSASDAADAGKAVSAAQAAISRKRRQEARSRFRSDIRETGACSISFGPRMGRGPLSQVAQSPLIVTRIWTSIPAAKWPDCGICF